MKTNAVSGILPAVILLAVAAFAAGADEPAVAYETTVPGYWLASAHGVAADGAGNAYFIGKTYEDHAHLDIVVMKLDPEGTPAWTQYIVGGGHDWASDITLDGAGDVLVTGWTDSEDFPIVNGMDDELTGFREAFVMKLSRFDGSIVFSTFLGGDYTDTGDGIAVNDAGEIVIVGTTGSTDFPVTADAYQSGPNAPLYIYTDLFFTRLTAEGDSILYSTYFGGFKDDTAEGLALDGSGNMIVAGRTTSDDFPLVDPYQSDPNELFVSKLSADGGTLLYSTYFGGSDLDGIRGLAADAAGNAYLTGDTRSTDFPVTAGAYQETFAGAIGGCGSPPYEPIHNCEDVYLAKLATDGSGLAYGTYLGGSKIEGGSDVVVDPSGSAMVVGWYGSNDFPGADGSGGASLFVSRLSADGSDLYYTHSKSSGSANAGHGIAISPGGDVYFAGALNVPAEFYVAKLAGGGSSNATSVGDAPAPAAAARLLEPRPNPFNPVTSIRFTLGESAPVRLVVYDPAGREVTTLADGRFPAGEFERTWNGRDRSGRPVPSGVFFARFESGKSADTKKIVLVR